MLADGVDFHGGRRTYDDNRHAVEESDTIVYPVRFDTRAEAERLAREQTRGGRPVDLAPADNPLMLPRAFRQIADELRTQ